MPVLENWVQKQLDQGISRQKIKQILKKRGYSDEILEDVDTVDTTSERKFRRTRKEMKVAEILALVVALLALLTGALFSYTAFKQPTEAEQIANLSIVYGNVSLMKVAGNSMQPLFNDGDVVFVATGNFSINTGNVVVVKLILSNDSVIKTVEATEFKKLSPETPYLEGTLLGKQLAFYNYQLPSGTIIVLSENPAESLDSRQYGLVPESYVKGIVVK